MNKKDTIITIIVVILCVALVATVIVANNLDDKNVDSTVAHDHDGDGVADHDDSYHQTTGSTSGDDHDHETTGTTGNTNSANQEDGDIDISIEDLPNSGDTTETGSSTGN